MILLERPDGIKIVRVTRPEEAIAYRHSFGGAYQDVWSEPPYNERIFPSEAQGVLQSYLRTPEQITLLAVRGDTQVLGFAIAVPSISRPDITRELQGLIPLQHTFYLAELGVLEGWRGKGIGRDMNRTRFSLIDRQRYSHVLMRTSAQRNFVYDMFVDLGFDDTGVYTEVSARRTDERVITDRRVFLCKTLLGEHHEGLPEGAMWNSESVREEP